MNKINVENYLIKTNEAIKYKKYDEAYMFCNADLTKQLINMKRHSEMNPEFANEMIQYNLYQLEEIFKKLCFILFSSNINVDIDEKFDRIENEIENKEFYELVRYYRVLLISSLENDSKKTKNLLIDLDYNQIDKIELLEFYYEYVASDLTSE